MLKFWDLVSFKTEQFMFKVGNHQLPHNIQKIFCDTVGGYNLREGNNKKRVFVYQCVDLWSRFME